MAALAFDLDAAQRIEATYATVDVAATRAAVFRAATPRRQETVIDIGCGPGYLTKELAIAVGDAGQIIGVDTSKPMVDLARHRCVGLDQVRLECANALNLPVEQATVDLACAMQVFCYVAELDQALAELHRALKPGGRAVILDSDMAGIVWESHNRERMQKVLRAYDAHVAWPDLPRVLPRRLRDAGFEVARCEKVPILSLDYHPNTYVFGLARFIHQFITSVGFPADEADAWLAEFDTLERARSFFFSMDRFVFIARRI
jgi:arsenite methyltransferase